MDPKQTFGMPETDENNVPLGKTPPSFSTLQPVVGSSRPPANKRKSVNEAPQLGIIEALQHMFTPEQLRSVAEVFQAMASQTTPTGHTLE